MRSSCKIALALLMIVGGGLVIVGSPMVVFAEAAVPFFRALGLARVSFVEPLDGPCYELVRVHHAPAFAVFVTLGVLIVFTGTHWFVRARRAA